MADYVMADTTRTLAPRGWRCGGQYGSDGSVLFVAPDDASLQALMAGRSVVGPAVVRRTVLGGAFGRFEVARVAAMLFPSASRFVTDVEAEKIEGPFPRGLPPGDRITHIGPLAALYTTPANGRGAGIGGALAPGPLPVDGVAAMGADGDHDLDSVDARLPPAMRPWWRASLPTSAARTGLRRQPGGGDGPHAMAAILRCLHRLPPGVPRGRSGH